MSAFACRFNRSTWRGGGVIDQDVKRAFPTLRQCLNRGPPRQVGKFIADMRVSGCSRKGLCAAGRLALVAAMSTTSWPGIAASWRAIAMPMAPLAPVTAATGRRLGSSLTIRAIVRQVLFVVKDPHRERGRATVSQRELTAAGMSPRHKFVAE
jgi:hypothetical protein